MLQAPDIASIVRKAAEEFQNTVIKYSWTIIPTPTSTPFFYHTK